MALFRTEAIDHKRRKLWGEIRLAQPPSLLVWTVILSLIFVAILVVLIFGHFTRKETVRGFLESEAGVIDVRAVQSGRVTKVFVQEGQSVSEGQPLLEIGNDLGAGTSGPVLDVQLSETARQFETLESRRQSIILGFKDQLARAKEQENSQIALRSIASQQREGQRSVVSLVEAEAARFLRLQEQGFAPNSEMDARRRIVLGERNALATLDTQLAVIDARISDIRSQISSLPAQQAEALAGLDGENARLGQQKAELEVARSHVIRAPVSGVVAQLSVGQGFTPASNAPLLTIAPQGAMLQARVLVPTRAIGFLSKGQAAQLQIDAFPYQRFGAVPGFVSKVHPLLVRPGDVAFPIEQKEPAFMVEVFITREYVDAYGVKRRLIPGMALTADLAIDRRYLWQQLFDPILASGKRHFG